MLTSSFPCAPAWQFWKKRAEEELQRSGLQYTIVRPGGLKFKLREGEAGGNIVMARADTYGLGMNKSAGSILRSQVRREKKDQGPESVRHGPPLARVN